MNGKSCGFIFCPPSCFKFGWDEEDEKCISMKQVMLQQIQLMRCRGYQSFFVVPDSGAGLWCGEILNVLRNDDPELLLQCILPHEELATKWHPNLRHRYFALMEQCTHLAVVSRPDDDDAVEKALDYMAKCCDFLITVYSSPLCKRGAVDRVMDKVRKSGKPHLQIEPDTLELKLFPIKRE